MQRCNCTVRLSGDQNNTVPKKGVSPAEIAILVAIHGDGSITDIQPTHMDKTPHATERSRLSTIYGHHVVDRIFPGEFSPLPVSLKDLSLARPEADDAGDQDEGDHGNQEDPAAAKRAAEAARKRAARAAARASADAPEGGEGEEGADEAQGED